MRSVFARLVAVLWPCLACAAAPGAVSSEGIPPGWREFQIPAARFKVLMPGIPKTTRRTIHTDIGNVASTRYTATDAANATYDVLLNDYPKAGVSRASPLKLLDGARDGLIYQTKGRKLSEKPFTLGGFPGRELEIAGNDGTHYRARLIWAETRLYQVMVVTPGKPRPDANVFFDSFQTTGTP